MKSKNSENRKLWRKFRLKYRFTVTDEALQEEAFSFRLSPMHIFLIAVFASFFIIILTSVVLLFTPLNKYMPGHVDRQMRKDIIYNAAVLDSLNAIVALQSNYISNISRVMSGDIIPDTLQSLDSLTLRINPDSLYFSETTGRFIKEYEEAEKYNLISGRTDESQKGESFFYKPVHDGIVSEKFDKFRKHFGIDLLTRSNEPVMTTLNGTVMSCELTAGGYVMQIQHDNDFVSVYREVYTALKQAGDAVKAGEVIGMVGNNMTTQKEASYLHFELWYKGEALNPEEYIIF